MLKSALLSSLVIGCALAQAAPPTPAPPPDPPACLTAPQTKGNVTLSCSAVDATSGDVSYTVVSGLYVFGVKASSSDPDVLALRVELTVVQTTAADGTMTTQKRAGTVLKRESGDFSYVALLPPSLDSKGLQVPTVITAITVQELKASSSQSF